ncbi:MAG: GAF domain-containing protein [Kiritimatiellae bacterium]|nr:GAF domain-containing protein [Kiritimatiellia bacterium]
MDTLVQRVQDLLKADGVCYIESTGDDGDWEVRSSARSEEHWRQVTVSQSIIQLALRQNASILTTDPLNDERFDPGKSIVLQRITSAICSPLMIDDEPFGVLFIVRRGAGDTFSELELRIAATMANVLALYLRKSRLETEARQKNRLAVIGEVVAGLAQAFPKVTKGVFLTFSTAQRAQKGPASDSRS